MFRVTAIVAALVLSEVALQVASLLVPAVNAALLPPHLRELQGRKPIMIADDVLGWRGNPEYPGHDELGFLNPSVPAQADFVAIGDSVTYGLIGAPRLGRPIPPSWEKSWPAVVGELTGVSVYNMGLGGWGPVEYLQALDGALELEPRVIALGLFFGNDLFDCYRAVYIDKRRTDLADPTFTDAVAEAEADNPWYDAESGKFTFVRKHNPATADRPPHVHRGHRLLSEHVKLYGLARAIKDGCLSVAESASGSAANLDDSTEDASSVAQRWVAVRSERYRPFDDGRHRTIFGAPERYAAMNLGDPRIRASLHITLSVINRFADRCRHRGVDFLVVLLPNKEFVFEPLVNDLAEFPMYSQMMSAEHTVRERITAHMNEREISYVDTLDSLRSCLYRGESPYAVSADAHPNAAGYRAIAAAVTANISDQRVANRP